MKYISNWIRDESIWIKYLYECINDITNLITDVSV